EPVDKRIVGGTVDARERQTALRRSNRQDLPIPDMRGEEDSGLAVVAQAIEMFCVDHFDAVAGRTKPYIAKMRIFTEDAAEVIPHIHQNFIDHGRRLLGEGVTEVVRRITRYRQKSPECSAYPATECGRPIERQQTKDAVDDEHAGCLEPAHDNAESREKGRARLSHGSRGTGRTTLARAAVGVLPSAWSFACWRGSASSGFSSISPIIDCARARYPRGAAVSNP